MVPISNAAQLLEMAQIYPLQVIQIDQKRNEARVGVVGDRLARAEVDVNVNIYHCATPSVKLK